MEETRVLIKPIITEKSMDQAGRGRFTFAVEKIATKANIKKAVEAQFKVNVVSVQTLIMKGKKRRAGKKRTVHTLAPAKKAIVRLVAGQRIDMFEVQTEEGKKT